MMRKTYAHASRFARQLLQGGDQCLSLTFLGGRSALSSNLPEFLFRSRNVVVPIHLHNLDAFKIVPTTDVYEKCWMRFDDSGLLIRLDNRIVHESSICEGPVFID